MRVSRMAGLLLMMATACSGATPSRSASPGSPSTTATTTVTTIPSTTVAAPAPAWAGRTPAPTARQEVASAVADGRVWVIGGLTRAGATDVVESYDPATDSWAPGPPLPVAVHHAAAATHRGEIVVMGGFLASASLYDRPTDRVLALRGGGWVDLPRLRRPRGAAAAAAVGDVLVLAGGRDTAALLGPTELFDGSAWRDAEAIPTRRDHLSAASDGRSLFTVGGRFLSPGAVSAALERFDPVTGGWERLPALPTARGGQGAAIVGGRLVVAGGEDPSGAYGEVEAYDLVGQGWSALPPLPTPRHGLSVERVGAELLALVGGTAFGVAPSTVAQSLTPVS